MAKGFTLIEILVAVSIIGILSTIGITGFQAVTRSGRDALRKTDLEQIRSALEIYKSENSQYPDAVGCRADLPEEYMSTYPSDPKQPLQNYCYVKLTNTTYQLCAKLENGDTTSDYCTGGGGAMLCGTSVNCNYQVTNP